MPHPVKDYVTRVASFDEENFPEWDLATPLPKLPVPDLRRTMDRYCKVLKPIIPEDQYKRVEELVTDFCKDGGEGEYLQTKLKELSKEQNNWAYNWWLDDMYMKARLPLPVNSNPGMVFPRVHFQDQKEHFRFAARLISGILDYKTIIDARGLPVDRANHLEKGQPLCMEQYYRLFSSYRIPGVNKDTLVTPSGKLLPEPEHIIVICRNQYFVLDVIVNFMRLSEDNLHSQLERIMKEAIAGEGEANNEMVGLLTSADRDSWARARMRLMQDSTNRDSLDMIERCIFILSLDKGIPLSFNHQNSIDETSMNLRDDVSLACQMLHGMGSKLNSANRWFDKTMQFIVCEDGACGLNYEHSPSEGIAVIKLIEHLLTYMEEVRVKKLVRMHSLCELPYPRKLHWKLTPETAQDIAAADVHLNKIISNLDLFVLRYEKFGRDFPKSQKMSPDSFIQLALQLTQYKVHGRLVSTYESASTRRFREGRVDNIRANSVQALAWVKTMTGKVTATDEEKMTLFREALESQQEFMIQTILGHGIDCHLLGLKELALELERPLHELFTDETYTIANQFPLSTSQVPTSMDAFMCYGPVVPDGYGCAYNPHPDYILVAITSLKDSEKTSSDLFGYTLEGCFNEMYELCMRLNPTQTVPVEIKNGSNGVEKPMSSQKSRLVRQKEACSESPPQNGI
ncbi:choline O-acetyltransferase isoform X1 [Lingula anatina]|uniref:Choline O-acetyltransferase n=1 Tax=Lingula anatina TaxID=7574 RepID=A0A1S3HJJ2_LINAN|nr:choline O-acetyltransferase isoform X1 [Lingula anatina]|eukprot:XP_013386300.1 choline O-acetyltransferase isoform X1 [Lingula anatina]